jgi:hypothetical protein
MSLHQSLSALRAESESNIRLIEHELTYRKAVTEVIARLRQIADSDERPELAGRRRLDVGRTVLIECPERRRSGPLVRYGNRTADLVADQAGHLQCSRLGL